MDEPDPVTLDHYIRVKHGYAFKGEYFSEKMTSDVLLTPGNFAIGGGFKHDKLKYYAGPVPDEYILQPADLVISMTDLSKEGDTLGYPALIPESTPYRYLHNQRIGLVEILDSNAVDKRFLFYRLCANDYRNHILASSSGSTVRHTSPRRILAFQTTLPPIDEQRAIAAVLGALDDKIELNRRTTRGLERLARAIFRAWFVDFEPILAKAVGATSFPFVPPELFQALPNRLTESEVGFVPEGWAVKSLTSICTLVGGGTPKRSEPEYWSGHIPWYSVRDAPADGQVWVPNTSERITQRGLSESSATMVPKGCTIISARGTVGKLAMAGTPMAFNQSCYGALPNDGASFGHLFLLMQSAVAELQQRTHGSVFDTITRATFDGLMVVTSPSEVVSAFERCVAPLFARMLALVQESLKLAEIRNYLLPRLLSGTVRPERTNA